MRLALAEARAAAAMLGHWHRIEGEVIHGEKRGRELGYPTANMALLGLHLPKFGVYAVKVDVLTGPQTGSHIGAASLGVRPMFGENQPNLETFLFDFNGDGCVQMEEMIDFFKRFFGTLSTRHLMHCIYS